MTHTRKFKTGQSRPARISVTFAIAGLLAVGTLAIGTLAVPAHAEDHHGGRDNRGGRDHRGGRGYGGWNGGVYVAPPVVYGSPYYSPYYYPPPVVYGPAIGVTLPGVSIGIR